MNLRAITTDYLESLMRTDSRNNSLGLADRDFSIRLHEEHIRRFGAKESHVRYLQGHI